MILRLLAEWNNSGALPSASPQPFDNGADLHTLLQAQGQQTWVLCVMLGVMLFVAFSTRFRP